MSFREDAIASHILLFLICQQDKYSALQRHCLKLINTETPQDMR